MKRTYATALAAVLILSGCSSPAPFSGDDKPRASRTATGPSLPPPSAAAARGYYIVIREIGTGLAKDEADAVAKGRKVCAVIGAYPDDIPRQLKAVDEQFGTLADDTRRRVLDLTHEWLCKDWRMRTP